MSERMETGEQCAARTRRALHRNGSHPVITAGLVVVGAIALVVALRRACDAYDEWAGKRRRK